MTTKIRVVRPVTILPYQFEIGAEGEAVTPDFGRVRFRIGDHTWVIITLATVSLRQAIEVVP
jgi:hypothetical protein